MYSHTYSKSMDQPGKTANPARGQLNRENISLSAFVPENLAPRDEFSSPVSRQPAHLHIQAESGAYLRDCNVLQQLCVPAPARFERSERKYTTGVLCDVLRMLFSGCVCPNKYLTPMLFYLITRGSVKLQ